MNKNNHHKLCTSGDPRLYEEYRRYKNKLSNLIKVSKQRYYKLRFENATGNYRQTWALINEIRGKSRDSLPSHFTKNGITTTDKKLLQINLTITSVPLLKI